MDWMFKDFKPDLDKLQPEVRAKAIDIAEQLVLEKKYTKKEAMREAILRAEEWFYDSNA